jgi:hypothetical protein
MIPGRNSDVHPSELGVRSVQKDISVKQCLPDFLDAAIAIAKADKGNLQVFESGLGALIIAAQRGFASPYLEFFERVSRDASACAAAMTAAERVIVADVMKRAGLTKGALVSPPAAPRAPAKRRFPFGHRDHTVCGDDYTLNELSTYAPCALSRQFPRLKTN